MIQNELNYSLQHIKKLTSYLNKLPNNPKNKNTITYITLKQRAYAWYYVYNGNNKTDAYRRSFYGAFNKERQVLDIQVPNERKYSSQYIAIRAQDLHRKLYIKEAIALIWKEAEKELKFDIPQTLLEQLQIQATYDPSMFIDIDGFPRFKDWCEIPEKYRCCVEGIESKFYGKEACTKGVVLKLVNREKARKELLKLCPNIFKPEKLHLVHTTLDKDGKEVGIDDISKLSDKELLDRLQKIRAQEEE